jgi:hypothetical protein
MGSAPASLLLLLLAEVSDLTLPSGESSRPAVCSPAAGASRDRLDSARGASPWDRVRQQPVFELCLRLARSQIRLAREPVEALAAARRLVSEWPGRPEPRVLEARALLRTGDPAGSWQAWQVARELGFDAAREPGSERVSAHVLRDYAVSAVQSGHGELAGPVYRRLVSLLDAWPDPRHVQRIYLEAAAEALRRGVAPFDDAFGYLSAAERRARSTGLRAYAMGLRALLQARRGKSDPEANPMDAPEVWHFVSLARADQPPSYWPALPRHETYALASLLVERYSAGEAAELWDLFVAGVDRPGADPALVRFARERAARLTRAAGAP